MLGVQQLTVEVTGSIILQDVSVQVPDGQILAVLGPSGSGKTTLLRAIAGLQRPTRGRLTWNGDDLAGVAAEERGFGLMFQDYALFPHRSIGANVAFGLRMQGRGSDETSERVAEVLDWVGMSGYQDRPVTNLSGGEQQRVALARALAPAPRLLMFDEPLGSLDRTLRERLIEELRDLLVEHRITAIYVTHDQEEAFTVADNVLVLREGKVAQSGTPETIYRRPADEWTARFLGLRNVVEVQVTDSVAVTAWSRFRVEDATDGPQMAVLPPDDLILDRQGEIRGSVVGRTFRGGHYLLQVSVPGGPTLDVEVSRDAPGLGSEVGLRIEHAVVL
jgi:thiamine transport system ATP-binding protein